MVIVDELHEKTTRTLRGDFSAFVHVPVGVSFEPMVVLVGNKCDMGAQREVTTEEVRRFAEDKNFSMFMETSAKQGTNIEKLFESICKELVELHRTSQKIVNKRKNPSVASAGTVKLESRPVDEKEKTQSCSC